jgi:hypothetical protein
VLEVKKTVSKENSSGGSSYGKILKSSSVFGRDVEALKDSDLFEIVESVFLSCD